VAAAQTRKIAELDRQIENLTAALETAQAQAVTEDEIDHRVQLAVQNATAEARSRLAQLESYIAAIVKQGQALVDGQMVNSAAPPAQVFAPINRIKKLEMQVEENPRIVGSAKKIFRMLVAEYPDFPSGISKAKLASLCKVKVTSGGGFNQPLADLKGRRYIVVEGAGDSAIVSINPAML
jgi:hypothetical protein